MCDHCKQLEKAIIEHPCSMPKKKIVKRRGYWREYYLRHRETKLQAAKARHTAKAYA